MGGLESRPLAPELERVRRSVQPVVCHPHAVANEPKSAASLLCPPVVEASRSLSEAQHSLSKVRH